MIKPLHALLVAEAPAQPVLDSLRRAGYDPRAHYVTTPEAFGAALMQRQWDIVIARYGLPEVSAWDVLGSLRHRPVPPPLVVIADGLEGEDIVDLIEAGATDIIRSGQLARLPATVAKAMRRKTSTPEPSGDNAIESPDAAFHALAEHMPIGLYRSTEDGRILYANPALARVLGRESVDELLGGEVVNTLSYPRRSFVERIAQDGAVHNLEACWQRGDDETVYTRENTRAVRDENGDLLYYEGTMEDITEERTALLNEQRRVEQLEAIVRFSAAVDAAQNGEALHRAVVRAVEETLQADAAVLVQREDGSFEIRAWSEAISEESVRRCSEAEIWSSYPVHSQPLLLRDEQAEAGASIADPLRALMRQAGLRALGSFPLLYRGEPLGMIVTFFREPHVFSEGELRIAETLAWHVAVALSRWQAECELRDNEASLRKIADTTGHVLYRRRTHAEAYDYVSASIGKLTGYTGAELQAMGGLDALIETREVIVGGELREGDFESPAIQYSALYHLRTRNGGLRWVEDSAQPWIDEDGQAVGLVGVLQDVTVRRAREQAAREQHQRSLAQQRAVAELSTMEAEPEAMLKQITEVAARTTASSRVGLWVMHGGADGMHHRDRYLLGSETHEPAPSFPLEALLTDAAQSKDCSTLVLNSVTEAPAFEGEALLDYCEREQVGALLVVPVRRQGRCVGFMAFEHVGASRIWREDEQEFAENVAERVALVLEHLRRSRAEGALRSSELRYRAISELAADYAYSLRVGEDGGTQFEWATKAFERISGYTPEEVENLEGLLHLVHEEDRAGAQLQLQRLENGDTIDLEIRIRTKNGDVRWVSNRSRPVMDRDGRIVHVYSSGQDITERKTFERELIVAREQAEEMARLKSAFLANMSHEIRTPLTGILGFAGVLAEEVEESHREFVGLIEKSGRRLLDTLNSVLDLAQLESDGVRLAAGPLDVVDEVQQVVRLLGPLAEEKRIALTLDTAGNEVIAPLDPTCINRVLHNLVGNAIKFTEDGSIRVTVRPDGDRVRIEVKDTGIGIDTKFLPHLFDEFKQESMGQGRSHEGSGLGLAITRKLVELMGGTIAVESEKGVGSTFTILFPRIVPPAEEEASPAGESDARASAAEPAETDEPNFSTEVLFESELLDEVPPIFDGAAEDDTGLEIAGALEVEAQYVDSSEPIEASTHDPIQSPDLEDNSDDADLDEDVWWMREAEPAEQPGALPEPPSAASGGNLERDADAVSAGDAEPGPQKPAVLVVEDNDETRLLIQRVLRDRYEVDAVDDARMGLKKMATRAYDALVLDINLGGKQTGIDVLRVARAIPGYEDIVAVALTAYALPGDSERFLRAGFDRYVSKPFTKRTLLDALAAGTREEAARS